MNRYEEYQEAAGGSGEQHLFGRLAKLLRREPSVGMAIAVEGPRMGMQVLWGAGEVFVFQGCGADQARSEAQQTGRLPAAESRPAGKEEGQETEQEPIGLWTGRLKETPSGSCVWLGENRFFVQRYSAQPELIILGGGHISRSLAPLGKMLGFRVTVADDRPEFVSKERFPEADCLLCGTYEEIFRELPQSQAVYFVVVTRGHLGDKECVRRIFQRPFCYAGMIGSRKKVAQTKADLRGEGVSEKLLEELHAPIGLSIRAETPEEIAVSIAAELIQVKNREKTQVLEESVLEALTAPGEKVLAMIVEKHGSAPRGAGACMAVPALGAPVGTIGGGAVEYEAEKHARDMMREKMDADRQVYQLNNIHSAKLGMICGGSNEVMFLRIGCPRE